MQSQWCKASNWTLGWTVIITVRGLRENYVNNEQKARWHLLLLIILEQQYNLTVSSKADMHRKNKFIGGFQLDPTKALIYRPYWINKNSFKEEEPSLPELKFTILSSLKVVIRCICIGEKVMLKWRDPGLTIQYHYILKKISLDTIPFTSKKKNQHTQPRS